MGAPKDLIDKRMASALLKHAMAKGVAGFAGGVARRAVGGAWVGGHAWLTPQALLFEANAMNRHFHVNPKALSVSLPLAGVTHVGWRKALVTNIVEVEAGERKLALRCFRAEDFAASIRQAAEALKG